jgi:DNA-binding MarR family transcriptional regulator
VSRADWVTIERKYVNMTDVNFLRPVAAVDESAQSANASEAPAYDLIELLFFAYRDFVADADAMLTQYDFGRAHHRVLHFVDRNPDLTVAELLDILRITKQSLGRVLKELIDEGFVLQREGASDRRQRLLRTTEKGRALALDLAMLQTRRIERALQETGGGAHSVAARFLLALVDADKRGEVLRVVRGDAGEGEAS